MNQGISKTIKANFGLRERNLIMRIGKAILLNILCILLLTFGASAAEKYIVDDAKVLKQDTINSVESNLSKIYENTEVTVKFDIVKSLNGKSIDDYAKQYAKDNISGDKYILFVTSINDKKDIILRGNGINNILSDSDIKNIQEIPFNDYKANNYDDGIMKVGKTIDEKVTAKAVKVGKAEVKNDGYSTTVQHKTNYFGMFLFIIILIIIIVLVFKFIKRKADNDYEARKRKFAQDNNMDYDSNSFRSGNVSGGNRTNYTNSNSNYQPNGNSRMYDNSYYGSNGGPSINNTTIINDRNNNNGFVEGMIIGEMLSESQHHHHHNDYYDDNYRERSGGHNYEGSSSYENDSSNTTSGDWDTNNGSSWGDSSSDSSWDSGTSSDSGSSWDSGSDSGSSDW